MIDGIGAVIKYINSVPDVAAYVLINENTKKVYVGHSTKFRSKFGEIANIMDKEGFVEIECFGISAHPVYKLIMAEQIRLQYINKGYEVVNHPLPFIRFSVHSRIDVDFRNFIVYLITGRRSIEIVGVFKTCKQADEFKEQYYSFNWNGLPVYAINRETAAYWQKRLYKQGVGAASTGGLIESNEVTQIEGE